VTSDEAIIIAAGVSSLPAWAALAVSLHTQRRTLPAQTSELKQHVDDTLAVPASSQSLVFDSAATEEAVHADR